VAISLAAHAAIIGALLWHGVGRRPADVAGIGPAAGAVSFFALPAPAPASVDLPPTPFVTLSRLPAVPSLSLDLPAIAALPPTPEGGAGTGGAGTGAGVGAGAGPGAMGSGTGGEGDYIVVASPRTAILPPLAKVPGSVAGRTYRIRFWVTADGRVTRVEVDPLMHDEGYRREFLDRMMAYRFYPARARDGASIASVFTVTIRIGN
jgi:hypothetical protein